MGTRLGYNWVDIVVAKDCHKLVLLWDAPITELVLADASSVPNYNKNNRLGRGLSDLLPNGSW
jgi:hypothetical protein